MKKIIFLFAFAVLYFTGTYAQNAKSILDKASNSFMHSGSVCVEFSIKTLSNKNKSSAFSQSGKAYIKGNKFKIETGEGITWFDGKTQWTYVKSTNEVNVSNPDGEELAAISPVAILGLYKAGYSLSNKGTKKNMYCIQMTPLKKNTGVGGYQIFIDKQSYHISSILILNKNGNKTTISVTKYQSGLSIADNIFIFNKKDFPRAEVVDLR